MADDNPEGNQLPPGLTEEEVVEAIRRSGYPLQTDVARELSPHFEVFEEWGYRDRFSKKLRTLDVLAEWPRRRADHHETRIRPAVDLLLECKKTEMPYMFFLSDSRSFPQLPLFAGLPHETIELTTDDDMSRWHLDVGTVLWLWGEPLITAPTRCATFSKCVRNKGDKGHKGVVVLSGSDPYTSLTMPLVSAVEHFRESSAPSPTALWFDLHAVLPVAVVTGPCWLCTPATSDPSACRGSVCCDTSPPTSVEV